MSAERVTDTVHAKNNRQQIDPNFGWLLIERNRCWEKETARRNGLTEFPRWFHEAQKGGICGRCGRRLATAEPVVISWLGYECKGRPTSFRYTICVRCAGDISERENRYHCHVCGREVIGLESFGRKARKASQVPGELWVHNPCCSMACYWVMQKQFKRLLARDTRPAPPCSVCNSVIPDTRRGDTRYCSPACRQKAYRRRKGQPRGAV